MENAMSSTQIQSVSRATRLSSISMTLLAVILILMAAAPWWAGRADLRLLGEVFL